MLIPIPVGQKYTATLSATVPKLVKCEQCSTDYVYHLKRKGVGQGTSLLFLNNKGAKGSAEAEARDRLLRTLARSCEPVPCPACGHVQEHMIARARQLRHRWVGRAAIYLFPSACLLGLAAIGVLSLTRSNAEREGWTAAYIVWMIIGAMLGLTAAAGAAAALVLPVWGYFARRRYDPNTEKVEVRKALGQKLAVTKTEFERRQAGQASSQGSAAQPGSSERVTSFIRSALQSGAPLQTVRAQLANAGLQPEAAAQLVETTAGRERRTCAVCNLTFLSSVPKCSACGASLGVDTGFRAGEQRGAV